MAETNPTESTIYRECLELFLQNGGRNILAIEREMRARGHAFHRRSLYSRGKRLGWIERFGWKQLCKCGTRNEKRGIETIGGNPTGREGVEKCGIENAEFGVKSADSQPTSANSEPPTGSPDFRAWLRTVSPNMNWHWRHVQHVCDQLDRFTRGEIKRLMLFLPPRHGKSELVTVRYAAWRIKRDPEMNVIVAGYGQRLANRFSRKIRNVLADSAAKEDAGFSSPHVSKGSFQQDAQDVQDKNTHGAHHCRDFETRGASEIPHSTSRLPHSTCPCCSPGHARRINTVAEWETHAGGGFRAVGVGGAVTGFGANLIIIDDPIKSRQQAESQTYRDRTWDWYNDDISTRLEPGGGIILIQTRWHEDDLAGRLLRDMEDGGDQWEVISLPAIAESKTESETEAGNATVVKGTFEQDSQDTQDEKVTRPDAEPQRQDHNIANGHPPGANSHPPTADWRSPGEALCPERYDIAALEKLRRQLGTYSYSALYQQTPTPRDGTLFKRHWFSRIVAAPPPGLKWARGYDLAVSTNADADYTASFRCAYGKDGTLYIDGGFRARIEYPDQRRYLLARLDEERDTQHGVETALHGQAFIQDLRREPGSRGSMLKGVKVGADKMTRALTWSPLAEEGKVALVRGPWNTEFIDEAASFPHGAHDDQIDAVSIAVQLLSQRKGGTFGF